MSDANALNYWLSLDMLGDGEGDMGPSGNVLITGGTGTLGHAILDRAVAQGWDQRVTVFSRSELRQSEMRVLYPRARYLLGDVRDRDRLTAAIAGHTTVLHLAAMKRVPECEEQPSECMQTNVLGTHNVIQACIANAVERCVLTSTDKACAAITTYGASKRLAEGLITGAPHSPTIFTAVRYGNVLGSNGSVAPIWQAQVARGEAITVTDERCTRFWMSAREAVDLCLFALRQEPGTVAIPKMAALGIVDMARMLFGELPPHRETGLRSLEKLHEDLVHPYEQVRDLPGHYLISPLGSYGRTYRSDTARALTRDELLAMLGMERPPVAEWSVAQSRSSVVESVVSVGRP